MTWSFGLTLTSEQDAGDIVEERINRVLTQYRESPNLLAILRHDIREIAETMISVRTLPSEFDVLSAIGDQLTLVGKRMGWPRCHCICVPVPVFGFSCGVTSPNMPVVGLCEGGVWANCQEAGSGDICLDDDEVYRNYLLARRYQARQLWDIDSLQAAAVHIWGPTAIVVSMGGARVAIQPGRTLTTVEEMQIPLAFRVLPLAPGITPFVSYETGKIFGFGTGWGGLCDGSRWLCPEEVSPYTCQ